MRGNSRPTSALPIAAGFEHNHTMEKQPGPPPKGLVQWAITPPQSYAVYLVCLFLVAGLSFYVGTLKPKNAVGMAPAPVSAPRN